MRFIGVAGGGHCRNRRSKNCIQAYASLKLESHRTSLIPSMRTNGHNGYSPGSRLNPHSFLPVKAVSHMASPCGLSKAITIGAVR